MIMEVVPKCLNMRDCIDSSLLCQMSWEKHWQTSVLPADNVFTTFLTKGDVAYLALRRSLETRKSLQLQWRFIPEEHLGCILNGTPPSVHEFLHNLSFILGMSEADKIPVRILFRRFGLFRR